MYIGTLGIIHAVRKPATILVLQSGSVTRNMYEKRLIAYANIMIGCKRIENAVLLFDTGATESVLFLPNAVNEIGKEPEDHGLVRAANGALEKVLYYDSVIDFQNGVRISTDLIDVMEKEVDFADMIIGMDIISRGKLTVDGKAKTFTFEI